MEGRGKANSLNRKNGFTKSNDSTRRPPELNGNESVLDNGVGQSITRERYWELGTREEERKGERDYIRYINFDRIIVELKKCNLKVEWFWSVLFSDNFF